MVKGFDEIIKMIKVSNKRASMVVASAEDKHTIEACLEAEEHGLVRPIFVGYKQKIVEMLTELGVSPKDYEIQGACSIEESARKSVYLAKQAGMDFIMKGMLDTKVLLKAVVDKQNGITTDRLMTHLAFNQIPTYHKLLVITDGGMVTYPDLEAKVKILKNAVEVLNVLGYKSPKVACIAAVEKINIKMPETIDALKIKEMNQEGIINNCIVEGPISFDLAYDKESCRVKDYHSPVGGDADIIVVPDIVAGNILGKSLIYAAGGQMAGFIAGAKVPIILTSRSSSGREKYLSIALASLVSQRMQMGRCI